MRPVVALLRGRVGILQTDLPTLAAGLGLDLAHFRKRMFVGSRASVRRYWTTCHTAPCLPGSFLGMVGVTVDVPRRDLVPAWALAISASTTAWS